MKHINMPGLRFAVVAGLVLAAGFAIAPTAFVPAAYANAAEAKLAITRAEAKIDLISRETPTAVQSASFTRAQDKLARAHDALKHHKDQQAEWLANEAELATEATSGGAQLAELERTRTELGHSVDVLESELRTK